MTKQTDLQGDLVVAAYCPGQATAGTDDSWPVLRAQKAIKITAIYWVPAAALSGAATNNPVMQYKNTGVANAGTTGVTTAKTYDNGINSAANTPEAYTLSSTAADLNLAAGEVLTLVRTHNGSGLAQPDGLTVVHFQYR